MSPRNKRLEQAKPKADTPVKQWERKRPDPKAYRKKDSAFTAADVPHTTRQHRARPGMTSPQ